MNSSEKPKRVALLLPWCGRHPDYWDKWLESAKNIRGDFDFRIIVVEKPLQDFKKLAEEKLDAPVNLIKSYKLCDLKPMYGVVFDEELRDCDYWAFGDCDVIYGPRFGEWIEKAVSSNCDIASVQPEFCAGPFTMVRNCDLDNRLYQRAKGWREMLLDHRTCSFDELGFNWFRRHVFGGESCDDLRAAGDTFTSVAWKAAAQGEIKLIHEQIIDESPTPPATIDYLWHMIGFKNRSPWKFARGLLALEKANWLRLEEMVERKLHRKDWWRNTAWNNR